MACFCSRFQNDSDRRYRPLLRMKMGCFEMDYDSGRIHFKTTLPFAHGDLNVALLDSVVMLNLARMDRFLSAIKSVIYG